MRERIFREWSHTGHRDEELPLHSAMRSRPGVFRVKRRQGRQKPDSFPARGPLFHPETNHLEFNREFSLKHSYKIPHLFETLEEKAALMDALGFDAAVLSFSPGIELLDSAEAIEVAREANDWVGEAARRWQGRFYGFAALPVLDRDASIR